MTVPHPEEVNQFHCEQCGAVTDGDEGVTRQDDAGLPWALCPDCGGEYDTLIVREEGGMWVVRKANYHEIARFHLRSKARQKAEDMAFTVEVTREDSLHRN